MNNSFFKYRCFANAVCQCCCNSLIRFNRRVTFFINMSRYFKYHLRTIYVDCKLNMVCDAKNKTMQAGVYRQ